MTYALGVAAALTYITYINLYFQLPVFDLQLTQQQEVYFLFDIPYQHTRNYTNGFFEKLNNMSMELPPSNTKYLTYSQLIRWYGAPDTLDLLWNSTTLALKYCVYYTSGPNVPTKDLLYCQMRGRSLDHYLTVDPYDVDIVKAQGRYDVEISKSSRTLMQPQSGSQLLNTSTWTVAHYAPNAVTNPPVPDPNNSINIFLSVILSVYLFLF